MAPARAARFLYTFCVLALSICAAHGEKPVELSAGWLYRWGDSPRDASGSLVWLREPVADAWRAIPYPSNPPDRQGRGNVWYRVRLPRTDHRDPALFIYSIDVNAELYLDDRLVYAWGELDESGRGRFLGWPWHLVDLPLDAGGRELSVRIYSDYRDIGLWGPVLMGSRSDLVGRLYGRDAPRLAVASASLLLAIALIALGLLQRPRQRLSLHLGLSTLALVLRVLARTQVKQLFLSAPLLWVYLDHASAFLIAIFMTLVIEQIVGSPYRRVTRVVSLTLLLMLASSLALSLSGILRIVDFLPASDLVFVAVTVLLSLLTALAAARGNREARPLAVSFAAIGALTIYSVLVSNGLVAWTDEIDYLIVFAFSLGVSAIIVRRVLVMHGQIEKYAATLRDQSDRLKGANEELERKVAERTRELELANSRLVDEKKVLQIVSITDSLTGMHNRMYVLDRLRSAVSHAHRYGEKLSIVMLDLDHFKEVNDTWGHPAGDDVLRRVAEVFSTTLRESDLAGRYGGEEFLVVLPKADAHEAHLVAERIRARIEALRVRAGEHWLTASGGVAELAAQSDETLLYEADRSLYRAKEGGRNRIEPAAGGLAPR